MATIHIYTDADCEVFDFSEYVGYAIKGKDNTIELIRGRHKLRFFNMENCIDSLYVVQSVDADNMVDFIELDFSAVKAERYSRLDKLGRIRQEYIDGIFKGTGGLLGYNYDYSYHYFDADGKEVPILGEEYSSHSLIKYSHGIFLFEETYKENPERYVALNLNFEKVEIEQSKLEEMHNSYIQKTEQVDDGYTVVCCLWGNLFERKVRPDKIVAVKDELTGKYGFATIANKEQVLPYIYDAAKNFDKSIAPVILHGEKCIINEFGKVIAKINLPNYDDTRDGLPFVKDNMIRIVTGDKQVGFFNQNWELVVPPKYYTFYPHPHFHAFFDGYCIVCTQRIPGCKSMALIDKNGNIVSPEADFMWRQYEHCKYQNNKICADIIYVIDNKMGILSYSGKVIIPADYEDITPFNEYGIAAGIEQDEHGNEYLCLIDRDNIILRKNKVDSKYQIVLGESLAPTLFDFYYFEGSRRRSEEDISGIRNRNHNSYEGNLGPECIAQYGVFSDKGILFNVYRDEDSRKQLIRFTKTDYIVNWKPL